MSNPKPSAGFKKGVSGNPGGKPVGARNRVANAFLHALADDFDKKGAKAIATAREKDPVGYMRAIVALLPKEMDLNVKHGFVDLLKVLELERRASSGDGAVGTGVDREPERPTEVRH